MQQKAKCKLCHGDKELLKKSHIIPDFMYKEIFDERHKIYLFSKGGSDLKYKEKRKLQTGTYEKEGILCKECDNNVLGGYETYASKVLYGGGGLPVNECPVFEKCRNQHGSEYWLIKNIDYKKFKLFLLSILWRASVSKNEVFSAVALGPYEDTVREMILNEDPKEPSDFPVFMLTYRKNKSLQRELFIASPEVSKKDGKRMYGFLIAGVKYLFHVPKGHDLEFPIVFAINKNNEIRIIDIPKNKAEEVIRSYF